MASSHSPNDHSNYDMRPHDEMWANFGRLAKWTIVACLIIVGFMAIFLTGGHPPKAM